MSDRKFDRVSISEREMALALKELEELGYRPIKCSTHQLKIGPYNYYPAKRTIFKDLESKARNQRGLSEFINILESDPETRRRPKGLDLRGS